MAKLHPGDERIFSLGFERPIPASVKINQPKLPIKSKELPMNCVNGHMKFIHLTKPLFQTTVSLKRIVKLEPVLQ